MSEVLGLASTEINISLASQIAPEPGLPFHSATFYVDHALEAGYRGHEWYPLRNTTLVGFQTNTGLLPQYVKDNIRSAHQSWRSEKSLREAYNHPNRQIALESYVLMPHVDSSLGSIDRLQRTVGRKLPVVIYPDTVAGRRQWDFEESTYQPDITVMKEFGTTNIQEMLEEGRRRGFTSLTLDIHHMLTLGSWQDVLPQLLPYATEIHVALGRIDDQTDPETEQKLEDLYFGRKGSEIYQILEMIKKSRWTGRVVTEIAYQALKNLRTKNKDSILTKDFMEDHRRIVDSLKEALL